MKKSKDCQPLARRVRNGRRIHLYPFFRPLARSFGPEAEVDGRRLVMLASNDYLGLSHDPRVIEAAERAARQWGTGPGGSRFLCGNTPLHDRLEEKLAAFTDKKHALVHTTGFGTNLGVLGCLSDPGDYLLCDKENHASLIEGCRTSAARLVTYRHLDAASARRRLEEIARRNPDADTMLITDGVFSMSGDVAPLPELAALKRDFPRLCLYLDDAHGLGVLGPGGRGTAAHFGLTPRVDFVMGTFSKALASIGGFIAGDDEDLFEYLRHNSRTLIFSAALPASGVAAALAGLEILEREPERIERLRRITRRMREGYRRIGIPLPDSGTPILPIPIGDDMDAYRFSKELFDRGIFALPAVHPAVPRGRAVIRTAFMSTHEDRHLDRVLEVVGELVSRRAPFPPPAADEEVLEELEVVR